jgi:cell division protein FtsI (penicillin-binding protein 3)
MAPGVVPSVTGMTLRDAIYLLENMGLKVVHSGRGRVITQSQPPGVKVSKGGRIILKLG